MSIAKELDRDILGIVDGDPADKITDDRGVVISPDGEIREIPCSPSLEKAQEYVGGWVEPIRINGFVIYVNEEGRLQRLAPNSIASKFLNERLPDNASPVMLVGNVIVFKKGRGLK